MYLSFLAIFPSILHFLCLPSFILSHRLSFHSCTPKPCQNNFNETPPHIISSVQPLSLRNCTTRRCKLNDVQVFNAIAWNRKKVVLRLGRVRREAKIGHHNKSIPYELSQGWERERETVCVCVCVCVCVTLNWQKAITFCLQNCEESFMLPQVTRERRKW